MSQGVNCTFKVHLPFNRLSHADFVSQLAVVNVGVDHGCGHVAVTEKLLNFPYIISFLPEEARLRTYGGACEDLRASVFPPSPRSEPQTL